MSFEQVRRERRSAAELLSLMSFFNPQGIPESTLRKYSKGKAEADTAEDEEEADSAFDNDLDMLQAYSLVSITADNDACEMHALVQFCTRVWLSSFSDTEQWEQRFVALMAQELPSGEFENWVKCQQLLPHVEQLFDSEPAAEEAVKAWAQVLTNAAWYLWKQGSYSTAQQVAAKALAVREKTLGLNSHQTLVSVEVLASVLRAQGKYAEAETLNRQALEGYKKELGVQHPSSLTSVGNLALVLQAQGKYADAETLNRQALEGREKELGERHPSTLTSVSNLALVLQAQGKYADAETLNRRALEGREEELGERHPDTLTSVNNLALVLQAQGKYAEAETLSRHALGGREEELGKRHPSTLTSVYCLAYLLHALQRYTEAAELYRQACNGYTAQLGSQHPTTTACRHHFTTMQQEAAQARLAERENLHPNIGPAPDSQGCLKDI